MAQAVDDGIADIIVLRNSRDLTLILPTIFHSFKAGIANAISSSKCQKNNIRLQNVIIRLPKHLPQNILEI